MALSKLSRSFLIEWLFVHSFGAWLGLCTAYPPAPRLGAASKISVPSSFRILWYGAPPVCADAAPMPCRCRADIHRTWLPPAHCSRGRTWRPPRRKRPFALSSIAKLDPRMQGSYSLCRHYTTAQRCVFVSFLSGGFIAAIVVKVN